MTRARSHNWQNKHAQLAAELGLPWPREIQKKYPTEIVYSGPPLEWVPAPRVVLQPAPNSTMFDRQESRAARRAQWWGGDHG